MRGVYLYRVGLLLLTVLCLLTLWIDHQQIPRLTDVTVEAEPSDSSAPLKQEKKFQLASLLELSEVTKRPLFIEGRTVKLDDELLPNTASDVTKEPPFTMVVTGVVWNGDTYMAILHDTKNNTQHTLFLGNELPDEYAEWRLDDIDNKQIVVRKNMSINNEKNNDYSVSKEGSTKNLPIAEEGAHFSIEQKEQP